MKRLPNSVESYIGVSGRAEGLAQLPDGKFLSAMELNCVEEVFRDKVAVMDHQYRAGANAKVEGFEDKYYVGRRPNGIYIPRFRNVGRFGCIDYGLSMKKQHLRCANLRTFYHSCLMS